MKKDLKKKILALGLTGAIYATFVSPKTPVKLSEELPEEDPYSVEETHIETEPTNKLEKIPETTYEEHSSEETIEKTETITEPVTEKEEEYTEPATTPTIENNTYAGKFACVMYDSNIVDENGNYIDTVYQFEKVIKVNTNNQNSYQLVMLDNGNTGYIETSALQDLTETFVEVDISDQMLYVYSNGECVMTANVITGNPNTGTTPGTNIGLQEILYKSYYTNLVGPTWNVPVDYFFCFNYDGEGFHDASWREDYEYTTDTYTWNGSHGCVNMKHADVKELDNLVSTGDKVLIHK